MTYQSRLALLNLLQECLTDNETNREESVGALMESLKERPAVNEAVKDGVYIMDGAGNILKLVSPK